jgi:uncharacterized C2H2 Zn-finger protein
MAHGPPDSEGQDLVALTDAEFLLFLQSQASSQSAVKMAEKSTATRETKWDGYTLHDPVWNPAQQGSSMGTSTNQQQWLLSSNDSRPTQMNTNTTIEPQQSTKDLQRVQCFEHGCNGQIFSSRENYLRHVREKSGKGAAQCLMCGMIFTRRSNRDSHVLQGKCPTQLRGL